MIFKSPGQNPKLIHADRGTPDTCVSLLFTSISLSLSLLWLLLLLEHQRWKDMESGKSERISRKRGCMFGFRGRGWVGKSFSAEPVKLGHCTRAQAHHHYFHATSQAMMVSWQRRRALKISEKPTHSHSFHLLRLSVSRSISTKVLVFGEKFKVTFHLAKSYTAQRHPNSR